MLGVMDEARLVADAGHAAWSERFNSRPAISRRQASACVRIKPGGSASPVWRP
jgi:hypothetical protein